MNRSACSALALVFVLASCGGQTGQVGESGQPQPGSSTAGTGGKGVGTAGATQSVSPLGGQTGAGAGAANVAEGGGAYVGSSGGQNVGAGAGGAPSGDAGVGGTASGGTVGSAYDGQQFVLHEWGTNTVVVTPDGSMQRGLHHEEEDLPAFVYDRVKSGALLEASVEVKMETPVTYFYSPVARTVSASVAFPKGVLTQWFPTAASFAPHVASGGEFGQPGVILDPTLDVHFPFESAVCTSTYGVIAGGTLDWGQVDILAPSDTTTLLDAPLDATTWSYARQTQSNRVRVPAPTGQGTEAEKFLFYRGLGNLVLPATVTASANRVVTVAGNVGAVFVLNVDGTRGAFHSFEKGTASTLTDQAPALDQSAESIDAFVEDLGASVTSALDATGLFHDEAVAMVSTWKRQWFRTPGVRVLYLAPREFVDTQIPLTIVPSPDVSVRVMMMRVEVITPELADADLAQVALFDGPGAASAQAYFQALGRFAEPRLRGAMAALSSPSAGASAYLAQIATADTSVASGE